MYDSYVVPRDKNFLEFDKLQWDPNAEMRPKLGALMPLRVSHVHWLSLPHDCVDIEAARRKGSDNAKPEKVGAIITPHHDSHSLKVTTIDKGTRIKVPTYL